VAFSITLYLHLVCVRVVFRDGLLTDMDISAQTGSHRCVLNPIHKTPDDLRDQ